MEIISEINELDILKKRIKTFKTKHRINFDDVEKYRKISLFNQGRICNILDTRGDFGSLVGIEIPYKKWSKIKRFLY